MQQPSAKILLDSVSPAGDRLTTMEIVMHRFVLAEFNTHRMFSRNSASSRAIPFGKQVTNVVSDVALPVRWPREQPGMQGGEEVDFKARQDAELLWRTARSAAVEMSTRLSALGVHKSICNRLLEPFMWHRVIVSATEWENFFKQRCSPLAQPELRATAEAMYAALLESKPVKAPKPDEHSAFSYWHTPMVLASEASMPIADRWKLSVARCARVSYLTHDGRRDVGKDFELYDRLLSAEPPHASPFEHVARPLQQHERALGNFRGWQQLRHILFGN